jgi:hypothetical protein
MELRLNGCYVELLRGITQAKLYVLFNTVCYRYITGNESDWQRFATPITSKCHHVPSYLL